MTRLEFIKRSRLIRLRGSSAGAEDTVEAVVEFRGCYYLIDLLKGTLSHLLIGQDGKVTNFKYSKIAINDYLRELSV